MKWDQVIRVATAAVLADPVLAGIYGQNVVYLGTARHAVPLLEVMLIADSETELWAPCTLQWDQWCETMDALRASERRLRLLFHQDLPISLGGVGMWVQYVDGAELVSPDRDGFFGRAIRFRYTPLRAQYDPVLPNS